MNGLLSLLLSRRKPPAPSTEGRWPLDLPLIRFSANAEDLWTLGDASQGVLILGENGSGKTSGSGALLARKYLQAGFGGLVLCFKTDEADLWRFVPRCGPAEKTTVDSSRLRIRSGSISWTTRRGPAASPDTGR